MPITWCDASEQDLQAHNLPCSMKFEDFIFIFQNEQREGEPALIAFLIQLLSFRFILFILFEDWTSTLT